MSAFDIVRWCAAGLIGLASIFLVMIVPWLIYSDCRRIARLNEDRSVSGVWFLGSILGFVAVLIAPAGDIGSRLAWSWIPLAAEALNFCLLRAAMSLSGVASTLRRQREDRTRGRSSRDHSSP